METTKLILTKGAIVDLEQEAGKVLKSLVLAAGWDFVGAGTDLDISAILFDENNNHYDQAYFGQLISKDGSVRHSGDNRTGKGDGDDETVKFNLETTTAKAAALVLNNFSGGPLRVVKSAYARILDGETNTELARYELKQFGNDTAAILGIVKKDANGGWSFKAVGEAANGTTLEPLVARAKELVTQF